MVKLHDRLGLPVGYYQTHRVVLKGLPVTLADDLAAELDVPRSQVIKWVGASSRHSAMSARASEVFCRLVDTLDALLELHDGDRDGALRWLTSPIQTLACERPVDLIVTQSGQRAVLQVIHSIEYGLPV